MAELRAFLAAFKPLIADVHAFMDAQGLDDPTKV